MKIVFSKEKNPHFRSRVRKGCNDVTEAVVKTPIVVIYWNLRIKRIKNKFKSIFY